MGALAYADDIALIAYTMDELNRMLELVRQWSNNNSMAVNTAKTKVLCVGGPANVQPRYGDT